MDSLGLAIKGPCITSTDSLHDLGGLMNRQPTLHFSSEYEWFFMGKVIK